MPNRTAARHIAHSLLTVAALALLHGCASSEPESVLPPQARGTLRIVSSFPSRGVYALQTRSMRQAIDLALELREGSVGSLKVEHVALDGGSEEGGEWSPERERQNATAAAHDASVIAYIGPYNSGAATISLPITNRAGLLHLSPTLTWPGLTRERWEQGEPDRYYPAGSRNFARLMPSDAHQGDVAARWVSSLGAKRVYVLSDGSTYSEGLAKEFLNAAGDKGLLVVAQQSPVQLPASPELADTITAAGTDLVFYAPSSVGNALAILAGLDGAHLPYGVVASDTALSDQIAAAPRSFPLRVIFNGLADMPVTPGWSEFTEAYVRRYGRAPTQFAGNAYDLANLVLDSAEKLGRNDRAAITRTVLEINEYPGVTGAITFDEFGDRKWVQMSGYLLVEGRFQLERHFDLKLDQ